MLNMKYFLITVIIFILGGCSNKYIVTFKSEPPGASLICGSQNWGPTPSKLYYDESVKQRTSLNVRDCSANWISGASEDYPSRLRIFPSGGTEISVTRPSGGGYAQDAGYALQLRQTEAAESAAAAARDSAYEAQRQNNKTTTCYTSFGITTCY